MKTQWQPEKKAAPYKQNRPEKKCFGFLSGRFFVHCFGGVVILQQPLRLLTKYIVSSLYKLSIMKYNESSNKDELVEGILWRNYNG